jgi:GDPmannose 4,6-dehydratase
LGLDAKFYQASSSELYGKVRETPQTELTPFYPRSPYAAAKAYAFYVTQNYRESYGLFAGNGILFNHESPRRSEAFVTRKISRAVGRIASGQQECLHLGNLDARRDWGFAGDYIEAMWLMLQQKLADDYVVATGEMHAVREFCDLAFEQIRMPLTWEGEGVDEVGVSSDGIARVRIDPKFFRPAEVDLLCGNAGKARTVLSWSPSVGFARLVEMMVEQDVELAAGEAAGLPRNRMSAQSAAC